MASLARYRRTAHSSSDVSDAGEFLVSNVEFRVSAPPARPLPMSTLTVHSDCTPIRDVLGRSLEDGVATIFAKHGIRPIEPPELVFRAVYDYTNFDDDREEVGDPTVFTVAPWDQTSPTIWENAVKQAKRFVDAQTCAHSRLQHLNVAVEIVAEELVQMTYTDLPDWTPSLRADWECHIERKVYEILQAHSATASKVTHLTLYTYGLSRNYSNNPLTVFITVNYESEEARWPMVLREIQEYLSTFPHNLRVHMEHGVFMSYSEFWELAFK
ncbi:uncharacterized protein B0T15DRAFT_496673 [Chaetomium strumarium]|uniref:Uncharacterized protein n=1 Tax=Chaetomium strumarium TaxID=1170767 RepID=A0AAJ0GM40_9PEZI|nr:hypothetical protein B0T15DRAFT_496673 [Chaetomium strumarium]